MNPILNRELRAYWRHWSVFAVMFLYAGLLALLMSVVYADALLYHQSGVDPSSRMANIGQKLFMASTILQALLWMLIAPALTASTIATERESGLLEALQLTPLTPLQLASGKLLSALAFIIILLIVP